MFRFASREDPRTYKTVMPIFSWRPSFVNRLHLLTEINASAAGLEKLCASRAPTIEMPWVREARFRLPMVVIPAMGLCMGEIFYLKELAEDCVKDKVYEFFFCGPPLIITGGTGSPINPQAIK